MADKPPALAEDEDQPGFALQAWRRLRQGELGPLPALLALALIWAAFQIANPNFLSPRNLSNLVSQTAAVGTISVGVVLVLLLGEIDLSVGQVSGLSAAVMTVLNVQHGIPGPVAIIAGIMTGALIGLLQGFWITRFGVPSFIVTLAGLIGWQGALLYVLGQTGTININDPVIIGLTGTFLSPVVGYGIGVLAVVVYAANLVIGQRRRRAAGLEAAPINRLAVRIGIVAAAILVAIGVLSADRGVPLAGLILVGFVVLFDLIVRRTTYGRHLFAVGGNAEAARRAGISVNTIRLSVFVLASTLAACGGILFASRLFAVNYSSGGGDVLIDAIAAAVIGGTSLFGGRGTVWSALLGAFVIQSIENGLDLIALPSTVKYMVTGAVMLFAVTLDAIARQGRQASGRA
ncbi:MAG: sugar ABC transporter permease [Chloroflexi bacterium]|nr:MAG: sugar ABC transporter permease [Chloroflexota bacterium]